MEGTSANGATSDYVLRLERLETHLHTRGGVVRALDGVDLDVRRGETLGIIGESGSGKTMASLSILRLLPEPAGRIVGGHIWFEGDDLVAMSQQEMGRIRGRRIAMIPQDPLTSLNPVYTVGNQLRESIRVVHGERSPSVAQARAVDLFGRFRIADPDRQLRNYPHQLSGGMRQRVVGSIAMSGAPSLLIADEPTTALDATVQLQYLELLKELREASGVTIIFITHDFGVVSQICDRVAVMYAGKVVEVGPVREVFTRPSHPYTQGLIESVPRVDEDVDRLSTIPGHPPDPLALPVGCAFAPRCAHAFARCNEAFPRSFSVSPVHSARCWLRDPSRRD